LLIRRAEDAEHSRVGAGYLRQIVRAVVRGASIKHSHCLEWRSVGGGSGGEANGGAAPVAKTCGGNTIGVQGLGFRV